MQKRNMQASKPMMAAVMNDDLEQSSSSLASPQSSSPSQSEDLDTQAPLRHVNCNATHGFAGQFVSSELSLQFLTELHLSSG